MTSEENRIWHFEILENNLLKQGGQKDVPLSSLFLLDRTEEADEDAVSDFSYKEAENK